MGGLVALIQLDVNAESLVSIDVALQAATLALVVKLLQELRNGGRD